MANLGTTSTRRYRCGDDARSVVAQPYLMALEQLVATELSGFPGLVCKHFFSGAALYANMRICASLTPAGFAFKLPEKRCLDLITTGEALPLRYFASSPVKKGYVRFPEAADLGNAAIVGYLKECIALASAADD